MNDKDLKKKDEKEVEKEAELEPVGELLESIEDIMSVDGFEYKTIRAWGGRPARIGSLTAGQMITFLENNDIASQKRRNGLMLIALSLVKQDGTRLVNPEDKEAIEGAMNRLKSKDSKGNGQVVEKILELNGMNKKDAKSLAKNVSGEASPGSSPTGSPSS